MNAATMRTGASRPPRLDRRSEIPGTVESQIRDGWVPRRASVGDALDHVDVNEVSVLHSMLVQVRAVTLARIDEALLRLSTGQYGLCLDCGQAIGISLLRGLPFAEQCRDCMGRHEAHVPDAGPQVPRPGRTAFFTDPT